MNKDWTNKFCFDWVLINEIAVGTPPISQYDIEELQSNQIKSILSLCSVEEAKLFMNIEKLFHCERIVLPDHKTNQDTTFSELTETLEIIARLKKDGPVFIHCFASIERSPFICMAWLVKYHNLSAEDALDYLRGIHPQTNPLYSQFRLIQKLENSQTNN